jgi:hypothetical protein
MEVPNRDLQQCRVLVSELRLERASVKATIMPCLLGAASPTQRPTKSSNHQVLTNGQGIDMDLTVAHRTPRGDNP